MSQRFIKKEGMALTYLARYLLGEQLGARLTTIGELSNQFSLSVGVIQNALKVLESEHVIELERRGRNGTIINAMNLERLIVRAGIHNMVCAMPLPYTKLYEGLASGLKLQFEQVALYFAHMRGADIRIECLLDHIYDMAVVSRLAANHYLNQHQHDQPTDQIEVALALGNHSYVNDHQLICRKQQQQQIKRVGVDFRSPDQQLLTASYFAGRPVELVNIPYHEGLALIEKQEIDAMIWNVDQDLTSSALIKIPLTDQPIYQQATEAVILTRKDNTFVKQLIQKIINIDKLIQHQHAVCVGDIDPRY